MKVYCDTSVFVAAFLSSHSHHQKADAVLQRIFDKQDIGCCSAHSLAETFSVLLRMPTKPRLKPLSVLNFVEADIVQNFSLIPLESNDYIESVRALAAINLSGGRIYDLLHLSAAQKAQPDRIYTLNEKEWTILAPNLANLIASPV